MSGYSSTKVKRPHIVLAEDQKIILAGGKEIYSDGANLFLDETTISGINSNIDNVNELIITTSGVLQDQINTIYISLAQWIEDAGYLTLASGVETAYIEFNEIQDDLLYHTSATATYSGVGTPAYIGCTTYGATLSGINVKLSQAIPGDYYGIDWSIIRCSS